jgi:hypothetical protein
MSQEHNSFINCDYPEEISLYSALSGSAMVMYLAGIPVSLLYYIDGGPVMHVCIVSENKSRTSAKKHLHISISSQFH